MKFQSAPECVGVNSELWPKKLITYNLITDKSVEINFIALTRKFTLTEVKIFLAQFSTFRIFLNALEYQNGSKFARPQKSAWCDLLTNRDEKNLGVRKSREFLIFRPLMNNFKKIKITIIYSYGKFEIFQDMRPWLYSLKYHSTWVQFWQSWVPVSGRDSRFQIYILSSFKLFK